MSPEAGPPPPIDTPSFEALAATVEYEGVMVSHTPHTYSRAQVAELRRHLHEPAFREWTTPGSYFPDADWTRFAADDVDFSGASFGIGASFANGRFGDHADFSDARFGISPDGSLGDPDADPERFSAIADFSRCRFGDHVTFDRTSWFGDAAFARTTFGRSAQFHHLHLAGSLLFSGSSFGDGLYLTLAEPYADTPHRAGEVVHFAAAVIGAGAQIGIEDRLMNLTLNEASIGSWTNINWAGLPDGWMGAVLEATHVGRGVQLHCVGGGVVKMPRIRGESLRITGLALLETLRGAHLGELELEGVDLTECQWGGASIEKLRLGSGTHFARRPVLWFGPSPTRSVLGEDHWSIGGPSPPGGIEFELQPTPMAEVEDRYRSIRGALEQGGNGAAGNDFYYAEMQLRRLGRRFSSDGFVPPSVQGVVLQAYWLVSGYGLRAWRAVATLLAVLLAAALLYSAGGLAKVVSVDGASSASDGGSPATTAPTTKRPLTLGEGFVVAGQQGLSLRTRPGVELSASADAIGLALRILVPLLLVLAALAVRNRISRHHPWR